MNTGVQPRRLRQGGRDRAAAPGQRGDQSDDREDLARRPEVSHIAGSLTMSLGIARGLPITVSNAAIVALCERRARITAGSNWIAAPVSIVARAAEKLMALRYGRSEGSASATVRIRTASGMPSPDRPSG